MKFKNLLRPSFVFFFAYTFQFLLWYFFMPDNSTVFGVSNKVYSQDALTKYVLYIVVFLVGIIFANLIYHSIRKTKKSIQYCSNDLKIANIFLWVFIVCEIVYFFPIIKNFQNVVSNSLHSGFAVVYYILEKNGGSILSTFVNVFPYLLMVYFFIILSKDFDSNIKSQTMKKTVLLTTIIMIHSIFAAKRMYFIYYIVILVITISIFKRDKRIGPKVINVGIITIFILFISEIFRYGINIANKLNLNLLSMDVFNLTYQYLLNAYIFSDVNNAMVILDQESPSALVSTASPFFRDLASKIFGLNTAGYGSLDNWTSQFGTVNYFALLWYDFSYFSFIIIFFSGFLTQLFYLKAKGNEFSKSTDTMIYILLMTGLIANLRINFFAQTIFILPMLLIVLSIISKKKIKI
ncbi:O-antigen polymerase [Bacillus marinisedimentorum]|uniref:O-antigen polymerase n=1 Tax=Bacillus marinisedimentorum TaxID=1821260 RepID=UPI0007E23FD3|nr:O-antigen polymerase [Bacillus marinisedimentorum]